MSFIPCLSAACFRAGALLSDSSIKSIESRILEWAPSQPSDLPNLKRTRVWVAAEQASLLLFLAA